MSGTEEKGNQFFLVRASQFYSIIQSAWVFNSIRASEASVAQPYREGRDRLSFACCYEDSQ